MKKEEQRIPQDCSPRLQELLLVLLSKPQLVTVAVADLSRCCPSLQPVNTVCQQHITAVFVHLLQIRFEVEAADSHVPTPIHSSNVIRILFHASGWSCSH